MAAPGGLSLRALDSGTGTPVVLAVHATSFCADVWEPVRAALAGLAGADPRWVALDQRGHGQSDAPNRPEAYAWTHVAEDVRTVVEVLRSGTAPTPPSIVLLGHSSGATAALAAAGLAPEAVDGVVAVEPVLYEAPRPGEERDSFAGSRALAQRSRRRRACFADIEEARRGLGTRFPYSGFAPAALEAYLEAGFESGPNGSLTLRCRPEVEAWAYEGAAALDVWPVAKRIRAPVHLVLAEHSAVPAGLRSRLGAIAPVRDVITIPEATHFVALEHPREVASALARFLERLGGLRTGCAKEAAS